MEKGILGTDSFFLFFELLSNGTQLNIKMSQKETSPIGQRERNVNGRTGTEGFKFNKR